MIPKLGKRLVGRNSSMGIHQDCDSSFDHLKLTVLIVVAWYSNRWPIVIRKS